jgi:hypothetical protein
LPNASGVGWQDRTTRKVSPTTPDFENTYGFKLLSKLGIDPYSQEAESFLLRQKTLVEKRAVPTVNKFIKSQLSQ